MIKNAWVHQIQQIQPTSIIDDYYLGMARIAILLLQKVSSGLFLNHCCHKGINFDEFIADNRARDLCELYRHQYISFSELKELWLDYSCQEKYYFLVRLVYPSFYFDMYERKDELEKTLLFYRQQLQEITNELSNQIYFPTFLW